MHIYIYMYTYGGSALFITRFGIMENRIPGRGWKELDSSGLGKGVGTSGIMFITPRFDGIRNLFLYRL